MQPLPPQTHTIKLRNYFCEHLCRFCLLSYASIYTPTKVAVKFNLKSRSVISLFT